ncbi:MAG: helix-turn-helix domain-containing protein [Xanthobacteraceae bacterium]|nr:helix-turn-helix domain-containing protein [Xanthobacteraceae bacterium]
MTVVWHSDVVAERNQFASWREAVCQHVYAITPERGNSRDFRGRIWARRFGGLDVIELECEGHIVTRRREDIARRASDTYYVYCQLADSARFSQAEREFVAGPGDMVIADPNIPFSTSALSNFNFRIWRMPRRMLDPLRANGGQLMMTCLRRDEPLGSVLSSYLGALATQTGRMDVVAEDCIADNVSRLVAVALGIAPERQEQGREAVRDAKFARVLRYIDCHLAEPDLISPAAVAARLGMSVRALHLLFEHKGTSLGQWVKRRRLEEIKSLLTNPSAADRSIADIAFAWGFDDLSTFYRAFQSVYGMKPGDLRPHRQPPARDD